MATDMRSNRYASNPSTTRRCAIQSSGSGMRRNQIRLMQRGYFPTRMAWMMAGSSSVSRSSSFTVE